MRVAGLDKDEDWQFGRGKASYLTRSDMIAQNVKTRLKMFIDDWVFNIDEGIDWFNLLGQKDTEQDILREIERVTLNTLGVQTITVLDIADRKGRHLTIKMDYTDIFGANNSLTLEPPTP